MNAAPNVYPLCARRQPCADGPAQCEQILDAIHRLEEVALERRAVAGALRVAISHSRRAHTAVKHLDRLVGLRAQALADNAYLAQQLCALRAEMAQVLWGRP